MKERNDFESLDGPLRMLYSLLPFACLIILITGLVSGHDEVVLSMVIAIVITTISYFLARRKLFQASISFFLFSLVLIITLVLMFDQGIHDAGIIGFSTILAMAGLLLKPKQQVIIGLLILISISWLVFGEIFGIYAPKPITKGTVAELVITLVIVGVSTVICYQISSRLQKTLSNAEQKAARRKIVSTRLSNMLESKIQLTNSIHLQVTKSLGILRELMVIEEPNDAFASSLSDQLIIIECIHHHLYKTGNERNLNLISYLRSLGEKQKMIYAGLIFRGKNHCSVNIEQAMSLGLMLNEICHNQQVHGDLEIETRGSELIINLSIDQSILPLTTLADIMIRQVKGILTFNDGRTSFTLKLNKVA